MPTVVRRNGPTSGLGRHTIIRYSHQATPYNTTTPPTAGNDAQHPPTHPPTYQPTNSHTPTPTYSPAPSLLATPTTPSLTHPPARPLIRQPADPTHLATHQTNNTYPPTHPLTHRSHPSTWTYVSTHKHLHPPKQPLMRQPADPATQPPAKPSHPPRLPDTTSANKKNMDKNKNKDLPVCPWLVRWSVSP